MLVTSNWRMYRWIHAFRERAGGGRLTFGLHNYPDVTRLVGIRTRNFLRRVRNAEIWITETGGIVRHRNFKYDESRADKVVRHVFKLVAALPRVKRLYLYNWQVRRQRALGLRPSSARTARSGRPTSRCWTGWRWTASSRCRRRSTIRWWHRLPSPRSPGPTP
jgi:hypothetical protein